MKALIVDDCMITRELLGVTLEKYAQIDQAENGEQAVSMVERTLEQSHPYSLICLDLNMPGLSGHETLQMIRKREDTLGHGVRSIVFMITSSSSPEDMMEALISGSCDDYLTKPVMQKTLIELLGKHGLITCN